MCSQKALGAASLLESRYGIEAHVSRVKVMLSVKAGRLLGPSIRLALPFGLAEGEPLEIREGRVDASYATSFSSDDVTRVFGFDRKSVSTTRLATLGEYYDPSGDRRIAGAEECHPELYWFERASDWARWIVPGGLIVVGGFMRFGKGSDVRRPAGK